MTLTRISASAAILAMLAAAPAAATPAPPSAAAKVAADGTLISGIGVGNASHVGIGVYVVSFTNSAVPTSCAYTASVGGTPGEGVGPNLVNVGGTVPNLVSVGGTVTPGSATGDVYVYTYSAATHAPADLPFNIYVACPQL
ncbi:MAG TPA: hypothetical protein VLV55_00275 [Rhizomicrobium sp.]|nr:hypothetical protein [Rhizomicrobium sp.]